MRYVTDISSGSPNAEPRQVKKLSATYAVKRVYPREQPVLLNEATPHTAAQAAHQKEQFGQEERRQTCRRVRHDPVLEELRSGIDRRHHNIREGDIAEHVDVEV